jgi:putative membrane protein
VLTVLLALSLGLLLGIAAGLLPGLHPNTIVPIILGLSFMFGPMPTAIILVSAGVVNTFVNFIPSILLGAPEESTALGVLPGHKLLMEGRGYEAIKLCITGSFGGVLFSLATLPAFFFLIPFLYESIRPHVHWLLILVIGYLILEEHGKNVVYALAYFLAAGIMGLIVLNRLGDIMLFPLLTGLFGLPMMLTSIFEKTSLPDSFTLDEEKIENKNLLSCIGVGSIAGVIAGLLPGIGSTQSTILTQQIFKKGNDGRHFLMSIGAITACDIVYSILALWLINNPRSGIAIGVSKVLEVGFDEAVILIAVILFSAAIGAIISLKITKMVLIVLRRVNYQKLCICVLAFLLFLTVMFSSAIGLVVLFVSTALGLIPNYVGIRRTYGMGCLIFPTILFFAGITLF